jgi:hypothetical protein
MCPRGAAEPGRREGHLVAVNPDLTPKWNASLAERLTDGCNVTLPPNGTPGGCRAGACTGVDPWQNRGRLRHRVRRLDLRAGVALQEHQHPELFP